MKEYIQRKQMSAFFTWLYQCIEKNRPINRVQFIGKPGMGKSVLMEMITKQIIDNQSIEFYPFSVRPSPSPIATLTDISKKIINNHSLSLLNQNQFDILKWMAAAIEIENLPYKQSQIANAIVQGMYEGITTQRCILIFIDEFRECSAFEQKVWQLISANEGSVPIILVTSGRKKIWNKKSRTFFVKSFSETETSKWLDCNFSEGWSNRFVDISKKLFDFTGGNPLFLNYLINELSASGILTEINCNSFSEIKIRNFPDTITGFFKTQLDEYPASSIVRQKLEMLAMCENLVPLNKLTELIEFSIPQFELLVNELIRKDWIHIICINENQFMKFRHPILKEIIISIIPLIRKKQLHQKLYKWCKKNNQPATEIVKHFRYAGISPEKELEQFQSAVKIHKKLGEFELAVQLIDELLPHVKDVEKQHWLIEKADVHFYANNVGAAKEILRKINFDILSNEKQIRFLSISASIDSLSGNPNQAILKLEQSLKIKTEKPVYHWNAMSQLINYFRLTNKLDDALKLGENLLKMQIDDFTRVQTISTVTIILRIYNPEKLDINSILEEGMEICDKNGFDNIHSILCNTMGHLFWQSSSYSEALECYEKSLGFARSGAYAVMEDIAMQGIAMIYSCTGKISEAIKINLERETLLIEQKNENSLLLCRNSLMNSYLTIGHLEKAISYFEKTREMALKQSNISVLLYALNAGWLIQFHLGKTFDFSFVEKLKMDESEESLAPHKYQLSLLETMINFYQNGKQEVSFKDFQNQIPSLPDSEKMSALWQLGIMQILCEKLTELKQTQKMIKSINQSPDRDTILKYMDLVIGFLKGNNANHKLENILIKPIESIDIQFCWLLLWLLKQRFIPHNLVRQVEEYVQSCLKISGVKQVPQGLQIPNLNDMETPIGKLLNSAITTINSHGKLEFSENQLKVFKSKDLETFSTFIGNWGVEVYPLQNKKPTSCILTIKLLGQPKIFVGNEQILKGSWENNKMAQLFIFLILKGWHNKGMVEAETLSNVIWQNNGERHEPDKLRNKRKTMISRLRKKVSPNKGENIILHDEGWYGIDWNSSYLKLDLLEFETAFLQGVNPENKNRQIALELCFDLYKGSLVQTLDLPWIEPLRWEFLDMQRNALKNWVKLVENEIPDAVEKRLQSYFNAEPGSAFYADLLNRHYQKQGMRAMADEVYRRHEQVIALS